MPRHVETKVGREARRHRNRRNERYEGLLYKIIVMQRVLMTTVEQVAAATKACAARADKAVNQLDDIDLKIDDLVTAYDDSRQPSSSTKRFRVKMGAPRRIKTELGKLEAEMITCAGSLWTKKAAKVAAQRAREVRKERAAEAKRLARLNAKRRASRSAKKEAARRARAKKHDEAIRKAKVNALRAGDFTMPVQAKGYGNWEAWQPADRGDFACGFRLRSEADMGRQDDTGLNGIRLTYCRRDKWTSQYERIVAEGHWGDWGTTVHMCKEGTYITGFSPRVEGHQDGRGDDNMVTINLRAHCRDPRVAGSFKNVPQVVTGTAQTQYGTWRAYSQEKDGFFVWSMRASVEPQQGQGLGSNDDTALNGVDVSVTGWMLH